MHDYYPKGSIEGHIIQDQMKEFAKQKITFTAVKVNESSNQMIKVMRENYDSVGPLKFIVTDLSKACA